MSRLGISIVALFSKDAALRLAAQYGAQEVVAGLLRSGADINAGALHSAALRSDPAMVECLISHGANVNRADKRGCCPLHFATYGMNPGTVGTLLDAAALPNSKNAKGWTSVHIAAIGNEKTLREVLPRISSPSCINEMPRERRKSDPRFLAIAEKLLAHGADVRLATDCGDTPLHLACRWAFSDLVLLFVKHGADVNAKNQLGEFPLLWLSLLGDTELSKFLIERGADANASTTREATALHVAALHGHVQMVMLLVENGANLQATAKGPQGTVSALDLARAGGHERIVAFLRDRGG